tara:strand:- start:8812 stop:9132 length:321 start_codon:yes stop_codon:yes gene_type:complete
LELILEPRPTAGFFLRPYRSNVVPILETLSQHYFIDLVAVICMFVSIWLLGNQKREGFVFGMIAAAGFIAFNGLVESIPGVVGNLVLLGLNIRGWNRWNPAAPAST